MFYNVTISSPSPLIALGSLMFNGTAFWLNSALQASPVDYEVSVNSVVNSAVTSNSSTLLAYSLDLSPSMYTVDVTPAYLLDSATIQMNLNADLMTEIDDTELFNPSPSEGSTTTQGTWNANQCLGSGRVGNSCHTSVGDASITYTFVGDAITVWGAIENAESQYLVSIDGASPSTYSNPNITSPRPVVVLAHACSLGSGSHTITITSTPLDGASQLEIDYVQVYSTSSGSTGSTDSNQTGTIPNSTRIALIVGSILGCVAIALVVLFWLLWRQRIRSRENAAAAANISFVDRKSLDSFSSSQFKKTKDFDAETVDSNNYAPSTLRDVPITHNPQTTPWANPNPQFNVDLPYR